MALSKVIIRGALGRAGLDTRFHENYAGASATGFQRGTYSLWRPEWGALEQAAHHAAIYSLYHWELPPAADFEIAPADGRNLAGEIRAYLLEFERAAHVRPVIYTSAVWWDRWVGMTSWAADYAGWFAGYPNPQHTMKRPAGWWPGYAPKGWPGSFPAAWQFGTLLGDEYGVESEFVDMNWMVT